ncbi:right-handed parallel beta-helix repeat-containing protein [Microbulbifer sp. ZKSA006]|uniref:right-handed parallel beta-helix repeat-containing protein n=1 Tax=Microbulbifer sp. ZKSA006 TaxID=3243390 RepID=UPI0040396981
MQKKSISPLSAAIALLSMGIATGSQAQTVSCGDVITTPTTLDGDLVCTIADSHDVAITIEGPAGSLSMGEYSLTCSTNEYGRGILLEESGARLSGGEVIGCHDALTLAGNGSHTVADVNVSDFGDDAVTVRSDNNLVSDMEVIGDASDSDNGIVIRGDFNVIYSNTVEAAGDEGILINGSFNSVIANETVYSKYDGIEVNGTFSNVHGNISAFNGGSGIEIDDDLNTISGNTIVGNGNGGIDLDRGDGNSINGNYVISNDTYGIFILDSKPTNNTISGNTATGQTYDLYDAVDPDCTGSNIWENNIATTASPSCLNLILN